MDSRPSGVGAGWRAACAMLLLLAAWTLPAFGQTTSGNATTGQMLFTANCVGCHTTPTSPYTAPLNAANAGGVIAYAVGQGMTAPLTTQNYNDIAAYIANSLPANNPNNQAIPYNAGGASFTAFTLPNIELATVWGAITSVVLVSGPSKGTVSFVGSQARYTPTAGQFGSDSFTYRGSGPAGTTAIRTATVIIANPPPPVVTGATLSPQTGVFFTHSISATNNPTSYSLFSGALPSGLTLNTGTGVISGTPTAVGSFSAGIRAANAGGTSATATFNFTVTLGPPSITSASSTSGTENVAFSFQLTASNSPTSFSIVSGTLPPGLTLTAATGLISGTPTITGGPYPLPPYNLTVRATNATGNGSASALSITIIKPVPSITSASTHPGQTGVAITPYAIAASPGAITLYSATGLPAWASLNTSTGVITGTPTTVGNFPVTLTAANSTGTSTGFTLTFNITLGPPAITSTLTASAGEGQPFNYQVTASNTPTSFNATGLPPGLSINTATGAISGSPSAGAAAASPYSVTISATNGTGTGTATLTINLSQFAPVITSTLTASGQTGSPFTYTITASNAPTSFNATGLPAGLTVNTTTGVISGTPTTVGASNVTITAANGTPPADSKTLVINVTLGPPVVTSAGTAGGAVGFPFSYQVTATNSPTLYGASGLPPGLSINTATGLVSGTPTANGTFTATVSATNATATATRTVTITIAVGIPVVTSATSLNAATGFPFAYQIVATNGPTSYAASGLPAGIAVDPASGIVSGTFPLFGTYTFNVSATNGTGTGSAAVTVIVSQSAPALTSSPTASGSVGQPFRYDFAVQNGPASVAVSGLPPGLAYDPLTQSISGTPTAGGRFVVAVQVANTNSIVQASVTIDIAFQVPTANDLEVSVAYEEARSFTLPIAGQFSQVTIVTLPQHGLVSVANGVATYTPAQGFSGDDQFTYTATNPAGTTTAATVRLIVGTQVPVATAVTMTVAINTAATADMKSFVKASGLTGVSIGTPPAHGTVAVDGTRLTYTPKRDFFGRDTFTYIAYGNAGTSSPATVTVNVTGRPDPTQDRNVSGLVEAQAQAARRFGTAQAGNVQRRMETLHRTPPPAGASRTAEAAPQAVQVAAAADTRIASTAPTASDWIPASMVSSLVGLAGGHVALNGDTGGLFGGTQAWIAGNAQFGRRDAEGQRSGMRFSTDGLSVGIDRRLSPRLVLGLGAGYGRDESDVGSDGSRSKAKGASFALYGSYQPTPAMFIDMMVGAGRLEFDSRRHVAAVDAFATGSRDGTQVFGSVAVGAEFRREGLLLSPYARMDLSRDRLDAFSEEGVGDYALRFHEQTQRSSQVGLGLRAESVHDTDFGRVVPRGRIEYRRELENRSAARLSYADLFNGPEYSLTPSGLSRNALLLGFGADLEFRGGLRFGLDWQAQRQGGASNVHGVRLLVSQELDGRGASPWSWQPKMFHDPIGVEAAYMYDSNVARGRTGEELGDRVFTLSIGQPIPFKLGSLSTLRLVVTPSISGDKFQRYGGLGRVSAGATAELQYRASGAFDAMTWALVGRAHYDQYESDRRRGPRFFAGVSARRSLTDRIDVFAEAGRNMRDGRSDVFDTRDWAGKVNVDYSLGRRGILYLAGEYRRGDIVSTGPASLANVGLAEVFTPDDAFDGMDLLAYRFPGRTAIGTVGWNYPLGPRDALDLSWRRVQSSPLHGWGVDGGSIRYRVDQYSIVYLMRF